MQSIDAGSLWLRLLLCTPGRRNYLSNAQEAPSTPVHSQPQLLSPSCTPQSMLACAACYLTFTLFLVPLLVRCACPALPWPFIFFMKKTPMYSLAKKALCGQQPLHKGSSPAFLVSRRSKKMPKVSKGDID